MGDGDGRLRVLLDTNAFVRLVAEPARLSARAATLIEASEVLLLSAVSIFEIDYKRRFKRDVILHSLPADLLPLLQMQPFQLLSLSPLAAQAAGRLPLAHRDPFDRMLVAQALEQGVPLISSDEDLLREAADTPVVW